MSLSKGLKSSSRRFLTKLHKRKLLSEAEPELVVAFLERAKNTLRSARILFQATAYEDAVACAYYAHLYAASALLAKVGIRCKSHTGTSILLKDIFALNGFSEAKEARERLQYDPEAFITNHDAKLLVQAAERSVSLLKDMTEKIEHKRKGQIKKMLNEFLI